MDPDQHLRKHCLDLATRTRTGSEDVIIAAAVRFEKYIRGDQEPGVGAIYDPRDARRA